MALPLKKEDLEESQSRLFTRIVDLLEEHQACVEEMVATLKAQTQRKLGPPGRVLLPTLQPLAAGDDGILTKLPEDVGRVEHTMHEVRMRHEQFSSEASFSRSGEDSVGSSSAFSNYDRAVHKEARSSREKEMAIMKEQLQMAVRHKSLRASATEVRQKSVREKAERRSDVTRQSERQTQHEEPGMANRQRSNKKTVFAHAHDEAAALQEDARKLHQQRSNANAAAEAMEGTTSLFEKFQSSMRSVVTSIPFEALAGCIIVSNAVIIGLEVEYMAVNLEYYSPAWFQSLHLAYAIAFALEFAMRIAAYGWDSYMDADLFRWACLDGFIVVSSFIDLALAWDITQEGASAASSSGLSTIRVMRVLRISRLIRVTRIAKLMRWLKALRTLIHSIFVTLKSLIWALVLLSLIMYVFGILLSEAAVERLILLKETSREDWSAGDVALATFWGSLGDSVWTLFMSITGGISWQIAEHPLMGLSLAWKMVFMLYISFTLFAVLNVMTGVFCQSAIESAARDHDMAMQNVVQDKQARLRKFRQLFHMLDLDDTGFITLVELEDRLQEPAVETYFEALELSIDDVWTFFRLLDGDSGQEIDVDEFLFGCMRLRGEAKALDLAKLMHSHAWLAKQQVDFMMFCEEKFLELQHELEGGRSS